MTLVLDQSTKNICVVQGSWGKILRGHLTSATEEAQKGKNAWSDKYWYFIPDLLFILMPVVV